MLMINYVKQALLTFLALIKMVYRLSLKFIMILNIQFFICFQMNLLKLELSTYAGMYLHVL